MLKVKKKLKDKKKFQLKSVIVYVSSSKYLAINQWQQIPRNWKLKLIFQRVMAYHGPSVVLNLAQNTANLKHLSP